MAAWCVPLWEAPSARHVAPDASPRLRGEPDFVLLLLLLLLLMLVDVGSGAFVELAAWNSPVRGVARFGRGSIPAWTF